MLVTRLTWGESFCCWSISVYQRIIFSLAVFGRKTKVLLWPWHCHCRCAKSLTFCNISVITEDINLKLGICVHSPKSSPFYPGGQFKINFFTELCPLLDLDILSSIKHPTAERWHLHAVLLFLSNYSVVTQLILWLFNHFQTTNFRLFQTEKLCRRQFKTCL